MVLSFRDCIASLPPLPDEKFSPPAAFSEYTLIILDDDPTGCQTLYDVALTFSWEVELLSRHLVSKIPLLFILTNSRSLSHGEVELLLKDVLINVRKAAEQSERKVMVISRSDSTLRGHYPLELDLIDSYLDLDDSMHCLIPAFFAGGRYTLDDIHYVREGDQLIPASKTPFAKDPVFSFSSSNLKEYIEEKQQGKIRAGEVLSFSISDLRTRGPSYVKETLLESHHKACIVNAMHPSDLDVFARGAWEAILEGKKICYRTAASFLNSLAGIPEREPLDAKVLKTESASGGLIIVGSYVEKSAVQLKRLLSQSSITSIELEVQEMLGVNKKKYIRDLALQTDKHLEAGLDVVLFTSRRLMKGDDTESNLGIGKRVSEALVDIVRKLAIQPAFIVTKGGITSHDIGHKGFEITNARVVGQALPGVPVISPLDRPGLHYIIFPGNVGDENALLDLYNKLRTS